MVNMMRSLSLTCLVVQFQAINEAYKVLSDEKQRAIYDRFGSDGVRIAKEMEQDGYHPYFSDRPCLKWTFITLGILTLVC